MSFGPEEVGEEGAAEDGGDVDANKDVVRGDAAEVVVWRRGSVWRRSLVGRFSLYE